MACDAPVSYCAAASDSSVRPLALYRRSRVLMRLGDSTGPGALAGFAERYPTDSAAAGALYLLADMYDDRRDSANATRWYRELINAYPADPRASLARFRLAARAEKAALLGTAAALYQVETAE